MDHQDGSHPSDPTDQFVRKCLNKFIWSCKKGFFSFWQLIFYGFCGSNAEDVVALDDIRLMDPTGDQTTLSLLPTPTLSPAPVVTVTVTETITVTKTELLTPTMTPTTDPATPIPSTNQSSSTFSPTVSTIILQITNQSSSAYVSTTIIPVTNQSTTLSTTLSTLPVTIIQTSSSSTSIPTTTTPFMNCTTDGRFPKPPPYCGPDYGECSGGKLTEKV